MILLTGPTGSGKTTTLYSMISRRRSAEVNIVTVEDPIEYQLPGITQVQVNVKAGLTFAGTLRSILRQDPDVILIGEIRDAETAGIAFQAAVTGHLVLSTVHTKSSFAAITRLLELEVDPFLISSSLSLVVAQRLSRRVCTHCKEPYTPPQDLLQKFRLDEPDLVFYRGQGCPECGKTGYSGRMGIYEMLRMTDSLKELVRQKASESAMRRAAAVMGTRTLLEDGLLKVRQGLTNPEELLRVIEVEVDESLPCPKCGAVIHREFKSCPYCMFTLRNICESCGQDLKPDWKMCPYCTSPVRGMQAAAAPGENSKPSQLTEGTKDPMALAEENPVARRQVHALPPANSGASREVAALPAMKTPKIVVADDDKGIIKVIRKALEQLPMDVQVFTAGDGVEALNAIESNRADLVILDVMMPRMDGFAVCDSLRKDIRTAFLPILMLTANADQNNRTKGYMVGTDDYMSKPFEVPDFIARVARLLRRTYGL
jgi:CheY-like chemotaxis protein